jgi:exosortase/archaeosortase family protein
VSLPDLSYPELLEAEALATANRRRPARMALIFLFFFAALYFLWESAAGSRFEYLVIHDMIVRPAAWIIQQVWPEQHVVARGHQLLSPGGRLNVLVGCDGLEMLFLLWAAFFAYPFSWRVRMTGLISGAILIYVVNQGRIVTLWHVWISDRALFPALHGVVLPLVMVAFCLAFFMIFLVRYDVRRSP